MAAEDDVRGTSERFYRALDAMANGDASGFDDVWSHSDDVTAMHPIGGRDDGWQAVSGSFGGVASLASSGTVKLADRKVVTGEDLAYETGTERGEVTVAGERILIEQRVTNVYRLEDGGWHLVHHHADLSPAMVALLQRLQAA